MPAFEALLEAVARELTRHGIDLAAWALAAARVLPSVVLVPAFGLRALPLPARVVAAIALAACTAPALVSVNTPDAPWLVLLLSQIVVGLPVAVGAATTLWVATMVGNSLDELALGALRPRPTPIADATASPLGVLLSLGAAVAFLALGGPARIVAALAAPAPPFEPALREVVIGLVQGVRIAVLLAAPLIVLAVFFSALHGLAARATNPSSIYPVLAPARFVVSTALAALLLDRIFEALVLWMDGRLPPN